MQTLLIKHKKGDGNFLYERRALELISPQMNLLDQVIFGGPTAKNNLADFMESHPEHSESRLPCMSIRAAWASGKLCGCGGRH